MNGITQSLLFSAKRTTSEIFHLQQIYVVLSKSPLAAEVKVASIIQAELSLPCGWSIPAEGPS
jgi:hypothetical protein